MLPTNVLFRTFFIRAEQYGTAFAVDVGARQYLLTARHLLAKTGDSVALKLFFKKVWLDLSAKVIARGKGEVDLVVLELPQRVSSKDFIAQPAGVGEMTVGQDVYFVGYPYKMWVDYGDVAAGLPGPFLKKGALSSVHMGPPRVIYVDAINNEGFSGGPLYFFRNGNPNELRIAGIVSKFKVEPEPVIGQDGEPTGMTVQYNTGFLVAYDIREALDLIP